MSGSRELVLLALAFLWRCSRATSQNLQVPCFFIFGDSLVDNGNNNEILTLARANYMPYGIDFPQGVTGRFNNGRTTVDVLAQLLGFPDFIPPYSRARGPALLRGVNYASGAAGIRDETGNNLVSLHIATLHSSGEPHVDHTSSQAILDVVWEIPPTLAAWRTPLLLLKGLAIRNETFEGDHISLNQQVSNFNSTVQQMRSFFKRNDTALHSHLSRCIFYLGLGSNDYLNNYFMPNLYTTSRDYSPKTYATLLLQDYSRQLMELYQFGARKVVVTAVGAIGCIPYQLARYNGEGNSSRCDESINNVIILFNSGLQKLVHRFNKGELPGAKFVYVNSYKSSKSLAANAKCYGFDVLDKGCCGVGTNNGQLTCLPLQEPCDDRTKYLFWDAFHPSEAANFILAKLAYDSNSRSDVDPINIQQLAML